VVRSGFDQRGWEQRADSAERDTGRRMECSGVAWPSRSLFVRRSVPVPSMCGEAITKGDNRLV
jgi:hypothetical protein